MIQERVKEQDVEMSRICNFLKCTEEEILKMYKQKSLDSEILLRWSKLLDYDFFRLYSQHLIFYAPVSAENTSKDNPTSLPVFRKNIYTREVIEFILEKITKKEMTKVEVMEKYRIPKTTLYKWISKYKK